MIARMIAPSQDTPPQAREPERAGTTLATVALIGLSLVLIAQEVGAVHDFYKWLKKN